MHRPGLPRSDVSELPRPRVLASALLLLILSVMVLATATRPEHTVIGLDGRWWALVLATSGLVVLAARALLWVRYQPVVPAEGERDALPALTLVIPAYNEGPGVRASIESVLASDYPADRLDIIVVNDARFDLLSRAGYREYRTPVLNRRYWAKTDLWPQKTPRKPIIP